MSNESRLAGWRRVVRGNAPYLAIVIFLIVFPHLVGWITGDSPFSVGGRPRGQSVFWQSVLIEVFILTILTMSYNLIFGFTGVISFGHALFFGLAVISWVGRWSWRDSRLKLGCWQEWPLASSCAACWGLPWAW